MRTAQPIAINQQGFCRLSDLMHAMQYRNEVALFSAATRQLFTGMITGIRLEDGSGRNYLITMVDDYGSLQEVFVRAN